MLKRTLLFLFALLTATVARGGDVRYDQIPSDVTGYFHMDIDRFLSSRLLQLLQKQNPTANLGMDAAFGEHSDITIYTPKSDESAVVVMIHTRDAKVRHRLETLIANPPKDVTLTSGETTVTLKSLTFTFNHQDIHYTSLSFQNLISPPMQPTTRPKLPDAAPDAAGGSSSQINIGLGMGDGKGFEGFLNKGPTYTAFVGEDLIIVSTDIPTMAGALEVIQGKTKSLAQEDPQGLKLDPPPGVIARAGLAAQFSRENPDKRNERAPQTNTQGDADNKGIKFDLFGSFKANVRLARFDIGEDEKDLYVDGVFSMKDAASTEQMKNLVTGLKALISLSQASAVPLINPLQIKSAASDVILHWSWPATKLPELSRLIEAQGKHDASSPATAPSTRPAR